MNPIFQVMFEMNLYFKSQCIKKKSNKKETNLWSNSTEEYLASVFPLKGAVIIQQTMAFRVVNVSSDEIQLNIYT